MHERQKSKVGAVIGLVGYLGSGKTTIADKACNNSPLLSIRFGLSDPIIDMLSAMGVPCNIVRDKARWDEPLPILGGKTLRHAARTLGTQWGRRYIDQDVWTRIALEKAKAWSERGWLVIIDNVRFISEFRNMVALNATMIAVKRPGLKIDLSHESEQEIEGLQAMCDKIIMNDDGRLKTSVARLNEIMLDASR